MPDPLLLLVLGGAALLIVGWFFWPSGGLADRWRARVARSHRIRQQDALKQARLDEIERQSSSVPALAERLQLSVAQTQSTLAELEAAGHLSLAEGGIRLTPQGRAEAARIIRAHRLWERHLADETGYAEEEWHALAEQQEHRLTPGEAERLARQLGQPARDPHGDPIPTVDGEVVLHEGHPLAVMTVGVSARITHVEDEPADVYRRIVAAGLVPGAMVRVLEISPDGLKLVANGDEVRLPAAAAQRIAVLPAPAASDVDHGRPLHALHPGEVAVVLELSPRCRGVERRRLLDLGILPGTRIESVMASPSGDPTAYRVRDALLALRHEQAGLIRITPLEAAG